MKILIHSSLESRNSFIYDFKSLFQFAENVLVDLTTFWDDEQVGRFDFVIFNWPEESFGWQIPSESFKRSFFERMEMLKSTNKFLICVRHNILPHDARIKGFYESIFEEFYYHMDGVIHLGEFSLNEYHCRYRFSSKQKHATITHPIYESLMGLGESDCFEVKKHGEVKVLAIIGELRHNWERNTLLKLFFLNFRRIRFSVNGSFYSKRPSVFSFFAFFLWAIRRAVFKLGLVNGLPSKMSNEELVRTVQNSDGLLLLRRGVLNSGNLALAISFKKIAIVPITGNLTEVARALGMPLYNPDSFKSINKIIRAFDSYRIGHKKIESNSEISKTLKEYLISF